MDPEQDGTVLGDNADIPNALRQGISGAVGTELTSPTDNVGDNVDLNTERASGVRTADTPSLEEEPDRAHLGQPLLHSYKTSDNDPCGEIEHSLNPSRIFDALPHGASTSAYTRALKRALYQIEDFEEIESQLRAVLGSNGACSVQWGAGSIAFKCNDCEADPLCAICTDCYFKSNHVGHTVKMVRTNGGCCDCGDPSSWDVKGFCSAHLGITEEQDGPDAVEAIDPNVGR